MVFRTNKKTGQKFVPKPKGGKRISQTFGIKHNEHLTMAQINKILEERNIDPEDIIFEEDTFNKNFEGRKISLHPSNELIDNIIVDVQSPHKYDESELVNNEKLEEKQEKAVRQAKGIKEPEEEQEKSTESTKSVDKKSKEKKK